MPTKPAATPAPASDEVAEQLKALGAELIAVADDQVARGAKLRDVERFLGGLTVKDFPDLAESPTVQAFVKLFANTEGLRPGQVRNRGTLAEFGRDWTWDDVCREFESVTFAAMVSVPLTWNGVGPVYIQAGNEYALPRPFYDIYREHIRALRQKDVHQRYMMGLSDVPPDPNWFSESTAKLRAQAQMTGPTGQPGAFLILGGGVIPPRAGGEGAGEGEDKAEGNSGGS